MNTLTLSMSVKTDEELIEIINDPQIDIESLAAAKMEFAQRQQQTEDVEIKKDPLEKYQYASFMNRFVAHLIDRAVMFVFGFLLLALVQGFYPLILEIETEVYFLIISITFMPLYYGVMESSKLQATLGKLMVGIMVADENSMRIGFLRAFFRHVFKIISTIFLFLGFISVITDSKRQGWHDMIMGCYVKKKPEKKA